jgi:DNA mismatch repair ATPase MutS
LSLRRLDLILRANFKKSPDLASEKTKSVSETPLMKQYNQIKARHPQALLLFRVGDFYETFGEDAVKTSKILGIILTKRGNGTASEIELAGFPHHSLDSYLPKLVRAGQRVAICDQLEDPKLTKTIVKRGVTELVTPGVSFNDQVLEQKKTISCVLFITIRRSTESLFSMCPQENSWLHRVPKNTWIN